ncbi:MAG: hypothetical protein EOP10_17080 [Proteobacteria bacterium]|nr:MAG: hypothetical protein EOP10_17080 [Pseudomonadota bacterium]
MTWLCHFILVIASPWQAFAQEQLPKLSVLPIQLIGLDNEFFSRNKSKLEALHKQLASAVLSESQPLDQWLKAQGRTLSYNLGRSLHPVLSGPSTLPLEASAYVVPILCRIDQQIVVATQLVDVSQNLLLASEQKFTPMAAWDGQGSPIAFTAEWAQSLSSRIKPIDKATQGFSIDFTLQRGSHNTRVGSHNCLNMLLANELQKTMNVPDPLDLLEGYRLRQLMTNSSPKKSTRTYSIDWGQNLKGPTFDVELNAIESVLGSSGPRNIKAKFTLNSAENRLVVPDDFNQRMIATQNELLTKDLPQVSKINRAWVYLDRGRAWGLEMNDRLYFEADGRFVKGHVVGFYTANEKVTSPKGFLVQEGAIVFVRKGQREVKVGDTFQFDPTSYPTPWPAVRQPMKKP